MFGLLLSLGAIFSVQALQEQQNLLSGQKNTPMENLSSPDEQKPSLWTRIKKARATNAILVSSLILSQLDTSIMGISTYALMKNILTFLPFAISVDIVREFNKPVKNRRWDLKTDFDRVNDPLFKGAILTTHIAATMGAGLINLLVMGMILGGGLTASLMSNISINTLFPWLYGISGS